MNMESKNKHNRWKKLISLVVVGMLGISVLSMTACKKSEEQAIEEAISEVRQVCYYGKSDNYSVNVFSGRRESPYAADGVSRDKVDFAILQLTPKVAGRVEYGYTVNVNGQEYTGKFQENPFGGSFSADLKIVLPETVSMKVVIQNGEHKEEVEVFNVLNESSVDWKGALQLARTEFADVFEKQYQDGTLHAEIYIKLLNDRINPASKYYWYVAVVTQDSYSALVIDPESGEIIAKKTHA